MGNDRQEHWTPDEFARFIKLGIEPAREGRGQPSPLPATSKRPDSEAVFMARVIKLAEQCGWLCYHTHDSRRCKPGFPDLVLVREYVLYVELKAERGNLRPEQEQWAAALTKAGAHTAIWRPSDWFDVIEVLT
jgi:hypothetical protein